jgi:ketosteroid isomerase-like protein
MRLALAAALILVTGLAGAAEESDRSAVRGVIEAQIEAFRRDDAGAAYAFAAPGIRQLFPTEERFMTMVREHYKPVYRPRHLAFGDLKQVADGGLEQRVEIQDAEGVDWVALYTLGKEADGSWRITGCVLIKAPGQAV